MRIGTWNLAGRWSPDHESLMDAQDCDVWLLTEVPTRMKLHGYDGHATTELMRDHKHWAAVLARGPVEAVEDPHPASAAGRLDGVLFCSSVLPWKTATGHPWSGENLAGKMAATLTSLEGSLTSARALVWGGDWNQSLVGKNYTGSVAGRGHLLEMLGELDLVVPTAALAHRLPGAHSIDHIAVGSGRDVHSALRVRADWNGRALSDHDAYVVEIGG